MAGRRVSGRQALGTRAPVLFPRLRVALRGPPAHFSRRGFKQFLFSVLITEERLSLLPEAAW